MGELVTVAAVQPADRLEAWRHLVSDTFVPLQTDPLNAETFSFGAMRMSGLGCLLLSDVSADAQVVRRTSRLIATSDPEFYKLGVQVQGYCVVEQDGREAVLAPGDFAVYDTTRPYQLAFDERFRMLVIMFPRNLLSFGPQQMDRLTAVRVSGRQGLGAVVSPFLTRVAAAADGVDARGAVRLSDNVLGLLTTVFATHLDRDSETPADSRRKALLVQIQHHIEEHLNDPELTPASIASAHFISTRYLHKLFEAEGVTVTAWIRLRRLERARRDLADPSLEGRPVSVIGARWGILDASQFSRLFREVYGLSPREYRLVHTTSLTHS